MTVLLILLFLSVAAIQIPGLIKLHWWRDLICFSVLWSTALVLSVIITLGVRLPPITTLITRFISSMLGI